MSVPKERRLGSYELLEPLGAGGMGEVYRAHDRRLGREVAVKILPESVRADPRRLARFQREARLSAALNHPNVAAIHEIEEDRGVVFLVLELVPGETLADLLAHGPILVDRALRLAAQVADGLGAAHAAGIVHRDLKPGNVMVAPGDQVKLLDFGLATSRGADLGQSESPTLTRLTREGAIQGTVGYMSPEQSTGQPVDHRTDLWAFGCLLFEMLTGRRAFEGETVQEVSAAILSREPGWDLLPPTTPPGVRELLRSCLEKREAERLDDIATARKSLQPPDEASRIVWAYQAAMPEISRLMDADDYLAAHRLAAEVEGILGPDDPRLREIWKESSGSLEIDTEPPGASVHFQRYEDFGADWMPLGETPIRDDRFPRGVFRFRIEKTGFARVEVPFNVALSSYVRRLTAGGFRSEADPSTRLDFRLVPLGELPEGMIAVEGGDYDPIPLIGLMYGSGRSIPRFFVDRAPVTNRLYQDFVAGGGYDRRELWPESLELGGRSATWEELQAHCVDTTGRAGPGGWELGEFPEGRGDHPVTGVCWYEAAAYCAFRGRRLPTVFHWARAAFPSWDNGAPLSPVIARFSNFSGTATSPVGEYPAISACGALDMGGNVVEWTSNSAGDLRWVAGGSWSDPSYHINAATAVPPDRRDDRTGFRCVAYDVDDRTRQLEGSLDLPALDFDGVKLFSDEAFEETRRLHSYRHTPLVAETDGSRQLEWGAREEWVSIAAAYPEERVPIRLRLPAAGSPPLQAVLVAQSVESLTSTSLDGHAYEQWETMLVKSGRALVEPVLKGTFDRLDDGVLEAFFSSATARDDYLRRWVQDIGRTLDYLAVRQDIDIDKVAYLGTSFGSWMAPHLLAYEPRFRVAVLWAGGFAPFEEPDQLNLRASLLRRCTSPVLLVNGRYDYQMPLSYQEAMVRLFGTPAEHKRHVVFEASHWPYPRGELIRETLGWLDRYLGPVAGKADRPSP